MRVTGVEAETELDIGLRRGNRLPEERERVEPAPHGVVPTGGVREQHRYVGLEHLRRPRPAPDSLADPVLGVAGMDDDRRRTDLLGRRTGLLQDLPRAVAHVVARRADV